MNSSIPAGDERKLRATVELTKEVAEVTKSVTRYLAKSCIWLELDVRGAELARKGSPTKSGGRTSCRESNQQIEHQGADGKKGRTEEEKYI